MSIFRPVNWQYYRVRRFPVITAAVVAGAISGTAAASFGESSQLSGNGALSGATAAVFGESAQIAGAGALSASAAVVFGESASLASQGNLSSTSGAIFGASASLSGVGALTSVAAVAFGESASLGDSAEVEPPSAGFWFAYDYEYSRRERIRKEAERLEANAANLQREIDRNIAQELHTKEKERRRRSELRRLSDLAEKYREEIEKNLSEKVLQAVDYAIEKGTFSAMERLEREMKRANEEYIFLLEATSIILNS